MERINRLMAYDAQDQNRTEQISVTLISYDLGTFLDYFYSLNWGIRLEAHGRSVYHYRPKQQPGDTSVYAADALFNLNDRWLGIGIVYHLL